MHLSMLKTEKYTITADVELKDGNTNGVIISQAGRFGGWVLYLKGGKPHHEYNFFGPRIGQIYGSPKALGAGHHIIKYEFIPDAAKPGAGGKCTLYVDDQKVAEGMIPKNTAFYFFGDEGVDVGMDSETNVSRDYKEGENKFTGKIRKVVNDIKP
jgi:arylsulfatase